MKLLRLKPKAEEGPRGVILKHATLSNTLWVVENPANPFSDGGYDCNMCVGTHHYGKATHLWLEPNGTCMVSVGVLKELEAAGMPQMTVVGSTTKPPALRLGRDADRQAVDNNNRAIWITPGGQLTQAGGT